MRSISFFLLIQIFSTLLSHADASELRGIEDKIKSTERKITLLKEQLEKGGETRMLADILFSLSENQEFYSTLLYNKKKLENKGTPDEELDFTMEDKELLKAVDSLDQIVKIFPKNPGITDRALLLSGIIRRKAGQDNQALVNFKRITEEFPKGQSVARANVELADIYISKDDHEYAVEFLLKSLNPKDPHSYTRTAVKLSTSLLILEKEQEAFKYIRRAVQMMKKTQDLKGIDPDAILEAYIRVSIDLEGDNLEKPLLYRVLEDISPSIIHYSKALKFASKRYQLKKKHFEAAVHGSLWLQSEQNMLDRVEAVYMTYDNWLKTSKVIPLSGFVQDLIETLTFLTPEDMGEQDKLLKTRSDFEKIAQDYLTKIDKESRGSSRNKYTRILINGYTLFLETFPKSKFYNDLGLNLAEIHFKVGNYLDAGRVYLEVAKRGATKQKKIEMFESSVKAFILSMESQKLKSELEKLEARAGLRLAGTSYLALVPKGGAASTVAFNIAHSYYKEREFQKSISLFWDFLQKYRGADQSTQAALLIMDSYDQINKKKELVNAGRKIISSGVISDGHVRNQIKEIVEETIIAMKGGASGRNDNLLQLAKKFKGTSLGDKALYEAYANLKSQRDVKAYIVGEQLITEHSSSDFAKKVAADMAKMALLTADLRRAAHFFKIYAQKYPSSQEAQNYLNNAASLYLELNDFANARQVYKTLQIHEKVAEMDLLLGDWQALKSSCQSVPSVNKNYFCGVSHYFLNNLSKSAKFLEVAERASDGDKKSAARYYSALIKYKMYEDITMKPGEEVETIQKKQFYLMSIQNSIQGLLSSGHPKWKLAAQFLMGRVYKDFSNFVMSTPVPSRMPASEKKVFKKQLAAQAKPMSSSSKEFFQACLKSAEQFLIFNEASLGCNQSKSGFDESLLLVRRSTKGISDSASVRAIQIKIQESPRDLGLYTKLALILLKNKAAGEAAAVLSRAQEIDPKNHKLMSLTGVAQIILGNDQLAYENFNKAMKLNPNDYNAIVGSDFLYSKYSFNNKRKEVKELARRVGSKADFNKSFYKGL